MPRRHGKKKKNNRRNQNRPNVQIPLPQTPAELEAVLMQMLAPNNEAIKQASEILMKFIKKKTCVAPMVMQISASTQVGARQMAAVLLRTKMLYHWPKLNNEAKGQVQASLLERLVQEPARPVRIAVAALISQVAQSAVPKGEWDSLLGHLLELSRSQQAAHREVSMILFRALADNIGSTLSPHLGTLLQIFQAGLVDPVSSVADEALKAVGVLVELVDVNVESEEAIMAQVNMFRQIVPHLIQHTQKVLQELDEDSIGIAFQVFDDLAQHPANVLQHQIPVILQLMLHIVVNGEMTITLREKASNFIIQVVNNKPGQLTKHNLVGPLLEATVGLCISEYDEVFETNENTPQNLAVEILNAVVMNIPKRLVFGPLMENGSQLISSQNHHHRKGGFVVLAVIVEGCAENILESQNVQALVEGTCNGIRDQSAVVRAAAAVALTQFADHLRGDICQYHQMAIPCLLSCLEDSNLMVRTKSLIALEVFLDGLGADASVYAEACMQHFVGILQGNQAELQPPAINAIKSLALSIGPDFGTRYAEAILNMMASVMQQNSDELRRLRCAATECVGAVALTVGKDLFSQTYLNTFLQLAIQGMSLEDFDLRESTYHFFSKMALLLGQDFTAIMDTVMAFALASCHSTDGLSLEARDNLGGDAPQWAYDDSDSDSDEDPQEKEERTYNWSIRSGALDEKMTAINTITTIVEVMGPAFYEKWMVKTLKAMGMLAEYLHPFIRNCATTCLHEIMRSVAKVFPTQVTPGMTTYNQQAKPVVDEVIPLLILRLIEEDEKEVAAAAAEALKDCFDMFGLAVAGDKLEYIMEGVSMILKGVAPCQPIEDDLDEKEMADHDEVLLDHVTDLVTALCKAQGHSSSTMFAEFLPAMIAYCAPNRPEYDRSMSIGCFAEIAEYLGPNMQQFLPQILPIVMTGLQDQNVAVRRNSCFAAGTFIQHGQQSMVQFYGQIVTLLQPIMAQDLSQIGDEHPLCACRDNATSALARLIMTNPNAIPLAEIVPMFLNGLPLRQDMQECKYAYACLLGLFRGQSELMAPHTPLVLGILSRVLGSPVEDVSADIQVQLTQLAKALAQQMGDQLMPFVQTLPQENRERLGKYLQSS